MTKPVRNAALALLVLAGVLTGCSSSSDGDGASDVPNTLDQSTVPESQGFTCPDPTGDVVDAAAQTVLLDEPAGIDLVQAEAHIDGDVLAVSFQTVGPVNLAPEPFFDLLQGDLSSPSVTWELKARPDADGNWVLGLTDFQPLATAGGQTAERVLSTPVTVSGNTVSYRVPLTDIPRIQTVQWSFGSSSTQANQSVRIDDCTSLTASSTTTERTGN
jgi:hypothetical protein